MARINAGSLFPDRAGADQGRGELASVGEGHPDANEGEDADVGALRRPAGGAEVAASAALEDVGAAQVEDDPFEEPEAVDVGRQRRGENRAEGAAAPANAEDEDLAIGEW